MTYDYVNDANHIGLLQTTDNSYHKIVDYDMGVHPNCVAIFTVRAMCRNSANGDCAAFEQPVAVKCDSTTAQNLGLTVPSLVLLQKDLSLSLTNIDVVLNGTVVELHVKGKSSTTLDWMGIVQANIFYQP